MTQITNLSRFVTNALVKLFALQYKEVLARLDDATLASNGASGVHIITCHHAHCNTGMLTPFDGIWHLSVTRISTQSFIVQRANYNAQ